MLGELTPCGGGPPIPLLKTKLLVGRHPSCDIPLPFPTVSSRHCELELVDGYWVVRDLGSHNGTQVNGVSCQATTLMPNDVLSIARHRYTIVYTPQGPKPSPEVESQSGMFRIGLLERAGIAVNEPVHADSNRSSITSQLSLGELVPCGGGQSIPLHKPKLLVGRHPSCDISIAFSTVSARHCELEYQDGYWFVRDLGSRNGIRVDGERCESKRLAPNSILWISTQRYRISYVPQDKGPATDVEQAPFFESLLEKAGLVRRRTEPPARPAQSPPAKDRPKSRAVRDLNEPRQRWTLDEDS